MLKASCMICAGPKENLTEAKCPGCIEAIKKTAEVAAKDKLDYWQYSALVAETLNARRQTIGMQGKNDPRMWNEPVDWSAVRERLG